MLNTFLTYAEQWSSLQWMLGVASLIMAFGYQMIESQPAGTLRTILKTGSIATLAPLPIFLLGEGAAWALIALTIALALGSLGDYFLALKDGDKSFKRGIIAFLIGHLFYLAVMLPHVSTPSPLQIAGIILLAVIAIGTCWWLGGRLGSYRKPVWVYMGVISAMALAALAMPSPITGLGALLFVFSDAVIVVNQFGRPVPYRGPIVWVTYYAGQCLLAGSLLALLVA